MNYVSGVNHALAGQGSRTRSLLRLELLGATVGGELQPPPSGPGFYSRPRRTVYLSGAEQEVPDLSPMAPGDTITLAFDFAPYASAAGPVITVQRQGGADGQDVVQAVGLHHVTGAMVLQRFTAPLTALGSTYRITCQATVDTGDTITLTGRLPVRLR